jgi:hypothetical protein
VESKFLPQNSWPVLPESEPETEEYEEVDPFEEVYFASLEGEVEDGPEDDG